MSIREDTPSKVLEKMDMETQDALRGLTVAVMDFQSSISRLAMQLDALASRVIQRHHQHERTGTEHQPYRGNGI